MLDKILIIGGIAYIISEAAKKETQQKLHTISENMELNLLDVNLKKLSEPKIKIELKNLSDKSVKIDNGYIYLYEVEQNKKSLLLTNKSKIITALSPKSSTILDIDTILTNNLITALPTLLLKKNLNVQLVFDFWADGQKIVLSKDLQLFKKQ